MKGAKRMNYRDAKKYVRALATVRYVEERPFMIAIVELTISEKLLVAKGLSTCSITDRWDTKRGQDVARGRAEAKLARRVMRVTAQQIAKPVANWATITMDTDGVITGYTHDYYKID